MTGSLHTPLAPHADPEGALSSHPCSDGCHHGPVSFFFSFLFSAIISLLVSSRTQVFTIPREST